MCVCVDRTPGSGGRRNSAVIVGLPQEREYHSSKLYCKTVDITNCHWEIDGSVVCLNLVQNYMREFHQALPLPIFF